VVRVVCGNLISSKIIRAMLRFLPTKDLKNLEEIKILLKPSKKERRSMRRYGQGVYSPDERVISLYLWSIRDQVIRHVPVENNYYHAFLESIASVLFHEIGHHRHFIHGNGMSLSRREDKLLKKSDLAIDTKEKTRFSHQAFLLHRQIEDYANAYEKKYISRYSVVLPSFKDIRFIKIFRESWVDWGMSTLRQNGLFDFHVMAVIQHLRKCKLSKESLYSVSELCDKWSVLSFDCSNFRRGFRRKIRRVALLLEKPLVYVSKQKRVFYYFTNQQIQRLLKHPKLLVIVEEYKEICQKLEKVESLNYDILLNT